MKAESGIIEKSDSTILQDPDFETLKRIVLSETSLKAIIIKIILRKLSQGKSNDQADGQEDVSH